MNKKKAVPIIKAVIVRLPTASTPKNNNKNTNNNNNDKRLKAKKGMKSTNLFEMEWKRRIFFNPTPDQLPVTFDM